MYRTHTFNSFDEFNAFDHGWDVDFRVTQPGHYGAGIEQFAGQDLLVNIATFDKGTLQRGSTPSGMRTFALPGNLEGHTTWLDKEVETHSLMLFPKSGDLHCVAGGAMKMATLSVDEQLFEELGHAQPGGDSRAATDTKTSTLRAAHWQRLHHSVRLLLTFAVQYGHLPGSNAWMACLEEELTNSFVTSLPTATYSYGALTASAAARTTQRAISYIMDHLQQPLAIGEVSRALGCSRRSLETSFKRCTGTSLVPFIRFQRLSHCRDDLLNSTREIETVTMIARRWGFWHMSQFSMDYKKLFLELPSCTLARKP